jgi:DNA-binding protein Fis
MVKRIFMNKKNLLTLTLIISGLALNPVVADTIVQHITQTQKTQQSVRTAISNVLYNRGLDEDVAAEISESFLDETDEMLLAMLMQNLENQNIVTKTEVLEYLSTIALHRQKLDMSSYDDLIGMVAKIKKKSLDDITLSKLSKIAKINKQLIV